MRYLELADSLRAEIVAGDHRAGGLVDSEATLAARHRVSRDTVRRALEHLRAEGLLHSRQARYYPLTSLFLVLTLIAYLRWQQGARWGGAAFVAVAWCWFQVDYGTVWPVFAILFLDAVVRSLRTDWRAAWKPVATGLSLLAAIAPFVIFYRLAHRQSGLLGG